LHPQELSKPLGVPAQDSKALTQPRIKTLDEMKLMNRSGS